MADTVMETIYGKYHKYEIKKHEGGIFSSPSFHIHRDGKLWSSRYASLAEAVEAAKAAG